MQRLLKHMGKVTYGAFPAQKRLQFYNPKLAESFTELAHKVQLNQQSGTFKSHKVVVADSRAWTGRPRHVDMPNWRNWFLWFAPCPICDGAKRKVLWTGASIGDVVVDCVACDAKGTWRAYRKRRAADIDAINKGPRCGCAECTGEWDR